MGISRCVALFSSLTLSLTLIAPAFAQSPPPKRGRPKRETPAVTSPAPVAPSSSLSPAPPAPPSLSESLAGVARAEYEAGKLLFGDGDFGGAFVKFQKAYDLSANVRLLWNMAVCEKNLRHYAKTLRFVERYKANAAGSLTAQELSEADNLVATLRVFVSPLRVETSEADATVFVDDDPAGVTPFATPVIIDVGIRRIRVSKTGFRDVIVSRQVTGEEPVIVQANLVRDASEGRLVVVVSPRGTIQLDGHVVGETRWEGKVSGGGHTLSITAPQRKAYQAEVFIQVNQTRTLSVTLEDEKAKGGGSAWVWIAGGAAAVAAASVGGYFLLRPQDKAAPAAVPGTIAPGSVQLP